MKVLSFDGLLEISALCGTSIDDFVREAINYVFINAIKRSVFTFNGWSYIYRTDMKEPDAPEMVIDSYYNHLYLGEVVK